MYTIYNIDYSLKKSIVFPLNCTKKAQLKYMYGLKKGRMGHILENLEQNGRTNI